MRVSDVPTVVREYGADWLAWRVGYEALLRTGAIRHVSAVPPRAALAKALGVDVERIEETLAARARASPRRFFFDKLPGAALHAIDDGGAARAEADAVLSGGLLFWRRHLRAVGDPPDWSLGDPTRARWPTTPHWSEVPDLSAEAGDIKEVWEPARFTHVFALSRAFAREPNDAYPEAFWRHVESWIAANPRERGPHWRCGQEISLRLLAWTWGLHAFADHPSSTPARVGALLASVWEQAHHVRRVHWYARRCVRNNHAVSEGVALFTVGVAFPFLPDADAFRDLGARAIARELAWQVYEDGAYVQSSTNYARLAAQLVTWAIRLGERAGAPLDPVVRERGARLLAYLLALQDPRSGRVPNFGANDGALLFPLATGDFLDHRATNAALARALGMPSPYAPGPWDEASVWFVVDAAGHAPSTIPQRLAFPVGGTYVLRADGVHAVVRAGTPAHRPLQSDMMHLDAFVDGENVLIDPGTSSYNLPPAWRDWFSGTRGHNTVMVDGRDPMRRGAKFMWLDWPRCVVHERASGPDAALVDAEHFGYAPVAHRRRVLLDGDLLCAIDEVGGDAEAHDVRLHWLLADLAASTRDDGATLTLPSGKEVDLLVRSGAATRASWARADADPPRGWHAPHYDERLPALSGAWKARAARARFVTLLGPPARVRALAALGAEELAATVERRTRARLGGEGP